MSNSVAKTSEQYDTHEAMWIKCRDAIDGEESIKAKGEEYLPKLSGQETEDYKKYKKQALYMNATSRTFKAYKGMIFRKDPDINAGGMEDFLEDCTLSGKSVMDFIDDMVKEELTTSRFGILVDHPDQTDSNLSQREAEQMGNRPYFVAYAAEDILKPKTKRIGNRTVLTQVRLQETIEDESNDEFESEEIKQIRVLDLDPEREYIYRQRVFRETDEESGEWVEVPDLRRWPKMNGEYIKEIPFYMTGGYEFRTPHMLDLVNVNLSHYIAYADHRKGVSFTTRPQPWVTGVKTEDLPDELILGSGSLWNFPHPDAEVGMLEYTGSGLSASEKNLEKLEEWMANLGARMLMPEKTEKTAKEFVIRKQGENSSLSDVSKLVSQCFEKALKFAAGWMQVDPEDVSAILNTDFIPFEATPEDLVRMITAVQTGQWLQDDMLWWAEKNEMVDPSIPMEDRKATLETQRPEGL